MQTESHSDQQQPEHITPEPERAAEPEYSAAEPQYNTVELRRNASQTFAPTAEGALAPEPAPEPSLFNLGLVGQRLAGRYLIEEPLGSGGMSLVYKGKHEAIDRTVAIKTLKMDLCSDPIILQRFEREVKGLSRLNHPNIVTVYDCVISPQGQPFIIMDFIDGESLDHTIEHEKVIDPTRAVKMFMQVCQALEHAHRHGVIHRDLKPANIMLTKVTADNEQVKVVDFGLAQLMENTQRLTSTGQLWGSAPYMSPEQCMADEHVVIDHRTDVYSLGVVIYEALTGRDPYFNSDLMQTIANHITMVPPTFKETNPDVTVPPVLEAVVFKALEKNPDHRFQSMAEFKEALSYAASPLLKQEELQRAKEMQSKMEAQQQRAIKQKQVKQNNLRKAQHKERINVVPIVIATSCITLALTVGTALVLTRNMNNAKPPASQTNAQQQSQSTANPPTASSPKGTENPAEHPGKNAAHNRAQNRARIEHTTAGQTVKPAVEATPKPEATKPAHARPAIAAPHTEHENKIKHPPVPKHVPTAAPAKSAEPPASKPAGSSANPWSTLENLHSK